LAVELARIYVEYQPQGDIAGHLAEDAKLQDQPRFLPASITVHTKDLDSTSYNIRSLDQYLPMFYAHGDEDDSDGEVSLVREAIQGSFSHGDLVWVASQLPHSLPSPTRPLSLISIH
jgi:hypothetical protein